MKKYTIIAASMSLSLISITTMALQIDGPSVVNDTRSEAKFVGTCTGVTFPAKIKGDEAAIITQDSTATPGICTDLKYEVGKSVCIFDYDKSNKTFSVLPGACRTPSDNAMLELYTPST